MARSNNWGILMIVGHKCFPFNHWTSSTIDKIPNWSISSTSSYKGGKYIYLSKKTICKSCHTKCQQMNNKSISN
jgi:hypothetical protein